MKAATSLQIPANRFHDTIREVWMSAAARHKAAWELGQQPQCRAAPTILSGATLDNANESSNSALGTSRGGHVLENADTSSSFGSFSDGGGPVIYVSS
jgi:hypothetical protein